MTAKYQEGTWLFDFAVGGQEMNLKIERVKKGLNQYDLAVKTKIPQSTISLIENGYRKPTEVQKKAIAKVLKTSIQELFPKHEEGQECAAVG
jgi:transcriptional regulator with XRE-family HTH domain